MKTYEITKNGETLVNGIKQSGSPEIKGDIDLTIESWKQYQSLAMRTNSAKVGRYEQKNNDFIHGAAGLLTEIKEWQEAEDELNAIEELGDCAWFIALCCQALDIIELESIKPTKTNRPLIMLGIDLLDISKRWFAYDIMNPEHRAEALDLIASITEKLGITHKVMQQNIAKLMVRYPVGFTKFDAEERNKKAEYKAINEVQK